MARSRRKYRRSASQRAASLLALALPAPIARAADTRLGPLLMFIGVPLMIIFGLLQVNWQNGTPHLSINAAKAHELGDAAKNRLHHLDADGRFQQLEQTAVDAWNASRGQAPHQGYSTSQFGTTNSGTLGYGSQTNGRSTPTSVNSPAPFPSTKAKPAYAQPNYAANGQATSASTPPSFGSNQINSYGAASNPNALTYQQQQQLQQQQLYQQQVYQQQLYQQQVYEQQLYQHQLYEQQLRQQQLQSQQQWQPQTNPNLPQQYNPYGPSIATPAGYSGPTSTNTHGAFPTNSFGRY